jgi:hypothetical protein
LICWELNCITLSNTGTNKNSADNFGSNSDFPISHDCYFVNTSC